MPSRGNCRSTCCTLRGHEEAVRDGGLQFVGVGRHARLQVEEFVGVSVYLLPWCRSQTDQ